MQAAKKHDEENVFELQKEDSRPGPEPFEPGADPRRPGKADEGFEAEFVLEAAAVCPHCLEDIERLHVVRMLRSRVNFVSSLPRRGQLLVCPKCRVTLGGSLGGLL